MENAVLPNTLRAPVSLPGGNDHPVVELPFTAVIDGRQFVGRGLSLVAAYVAGLMDPATLNSTRLVRLMFQFDGFVVTLVMDAEVRESAHGAGEAELIFSRPTGPHLPQLRHILNAFIAGDLVGLGQAIGVAGTAAPRAPVRPLRAEARLSPRRILGGAGIGLLTLGLVAAFGTLAYDRMFVTLLPAPGIVVSTGEILRATTSGQIAFIDPAAAKGEVVVAIQAASGDIHSLVSPCDCAVALDGLREGSTVLVGEPILQFTDAAAERLVRVSVPPAIAFDMATASRIELVFPGGALTTATPEPDSNAFGGVPGDTGTRTILLRPTMDLGSDMIGKPVEVRLVGRPADAFAEVRQSLANVLSAAKGNGQ